MAERAGESLPLRTARHEAVPSPISPTAWFFDGKTPFAWACSQATENRRHVLARDVDPVSLDCQHLDQVEMQFRIRTTALLSATAAGRCSCRCTAITTRCQVPHARSGRSCFKGSLANAIRPLILALVPVMPAHCTSVEAMFADNTLRVVARERQTSKRIMCCADESLRFRMRCLGLFQIWYSPWHSCVRYRVVRVAVPAAYQRDHGSSPLHARRY